ncbi:MAG TPA: hypothetical protein VHB70_15100 [Parafilimonas sp.]|nr:hypothetical protein [Parafilimonas sp.]
MPLYKSRGEKQSGVISYKTGKDFIEVQFADWLYTYSYASAGKKVIEEMKKHAKANEGLSTFISQHHPQYEKKEQLY